MISDLKNYRRLIFSIVVVSMSFLFFYQKKPQLPLLITGCARSGTTYTSTLLRECGLDIGCEKAGKDGVSSWIMCVSSKHVPWAVEKRIHYRFNHIFHQVRHPLKTMGSAQTEGEPSWKYIMAHIPQIHKGDSLIVKCAKYWYYWNLKAEAQAEWTYRVEDLENVWPEFCHRLGKSLDPQKVTETPRDINTREHPDITWDELKAELDPELYQNIRQLASKYGYSI